jgi:hypothetical protein
MAGNQRRIGKYTLSNSSDGLWTMKQASVLALVRAAFLLLCGACVCSAVAWADEIESPRPKVKANEEPVKELQKETRPFNRKLFWAETGALAASAAWDWTTTAQCQRRGCQEARAVGRSGISQAVRESRRMDRRGSQRTRQRCTSRRNRDTSGSAGSGGRTSASRWRIISNWRFTTEDSAAQRGRAAGNCRLFSSTAVANSSNKTDGAARI